MHHHELVLMAFAGGASLAVVLSVVLLLRRRASRRLATAHVVEPRSLVQLLTTEAEIAEAARRAASFERRAAQRATARATHYDVLADPSTAPVPVPVPAAEATVHDIGQRSAS